MVLCVIDTLNKLGISKIQHQHLPRGTPPHSQGMKMTDLQKLQDPPGKGQGVLEHPLAPPSCAPANAENLHLWRGHEIPYGEYRYRWRRPHRCHRRPSITASESKRQSTGWNVTSLCPSHAPQIEKSRSPRQHHSETKTLEGDSVLNWWRFDGTQCTL